jgi:transposase
MSRKLHDFAKYILVELVTDYSNRKLTRRPNLYELGHYVDVIFKQLRTGAQWCEIDSNCCYSTYHKKFIEWSKAGIFQLAHELLIKTIDKCGFLTAADTRTLSIDSSMIKNIRGCEGIGTNHYDRYRNASKVSVVVTDSGIPLAFSFAAANVHDTNMVDENLENIKIKVVGSRLLADKGYNSQKLKTSLAEKHNLKLIYPIKKNQTNKCFSTSELDLLKGRTIVENYFAWMKSFRRLLVRYDKHLVHYASFCYLGSLNIICNKLL